MRSRRRSSGTRSRHSWRGRDVLAEAPTGTGKTAAFALPAIARIAQDDRGDGRVRGLVLVPTRELAMQVAEAIHRYGRSSGIRVLPVYGGQAIGQQLRSLRRGVDLVVATPGRAVDHLTRGSLNLDAVEFVVLDEADEMLDMGFAEDLDAVLTAVPATRQTALFSATISPQIARIAKRHLNQPVRVTVKPEARERGTTTACGRRPTWCVARTSRPHSGASSTSRTRRRHWSLPGRAARSRTLPSSSPAMATMPRRCTAAWRRISATAS
jgi:ATP-dependent RNA helicase DeaD